jgi:hypothetical protein
MRIRCLIAALLAAALPIVSAAALPSSGQKGRAMLPDRLLSCTLGRVTNFDASKNQTLADLTFEGRHRFELFLPSVPVRTSPPPEAPLPPEPVNPRTRIVSDPDNIARPAPPRFDAVVDEWPERVELTTTIVFPAVNLIVLHPIDAKRGTAHIFMTQASDLTTYDLKHLYHGDCTVRVGRAAVAGR